ncbi:hypothetical protein CLV44_12410 [Marinobacterium halophilum]|uniref:Uncharacterized protein n=1 Tax=Marinobacterium halophilum TaxID=267374 RepID=A0A2P8EN78_9GAMM|nr:hypothetical protein [Marinobacterium halophilum]PSL10930.1 hypothetical protein CLV44_12410 [Marinobacterium halophilum]
MVTDCVRYEDIEEKRTGYYVHYSPVFTDQEFAVLSVHIYTPELVEKSKEIAETELKHWIERYPTPLMVLVKNLTDVDLRTKDLVGENYLLGYPSKKGVYHCWGEYPEGDKPNIDLSKESLAKIYSGLPFKTSAEVQKDLRLQARGVKTLRIVMILWLCVIPALIAYFGWSNPVVSFLALSYSLYMATKKGLELWGVKQKSPKELEKEKENQLKEHHHYHCKINPDGFLKLKLDNFKKERMDRKKAKIESMRN